MPVDKLMSSRDALGADCNIVFASWRTYKLLLYEVTWLTVYVNISLAPGTGERSQTAVCTGSRIRLNIFRSKLTEIY
jgi:hypothetical protein